MRNCMPLQRAAAGLRLCDTHGQNALELGVLDASCMLHIRHGGRLYVSRPLYAAIMYRIRDDAHVEDHIEDLYEIIDKATQGWIERFRAPRDGVIEFALQLDAGDGCYVSQPVIAYRVPAA